MIKRSRQLIVLGAVWIGSSASSLLGQVQSPEQVACILNFNKDSAKVGAQQGKINRGCWKQFAKDKLADTTFVDCLRTDADGKLTALMQKTVSHESSLCIATRPNFGFTDSETGNFSASDSQNSLVTDLFDPDYTTLVKCTTSRPICKCQGKIYKKAEKLLTTSRKLFLKCKKAALPTATQGDDLALCLTDAANTLSLAHAASPGGKLFNAIAKLGDTIAKACDAPGLSATSFAETCAGLTGVDLRDCVANHADCRACEALRDADALPVDCDLYDDGSSNSSCSGGI